MNTSLVQQPALPLSLFDAFMPNAGSTPDLPPDFAVLLSRLDRIPGTGNGASIGVPMMMAPVRAPSCTMATLSPATASRHSRAWNREAATPFMRSGLGASRPLSRRSQAGALPSIRAYSGP